MEHLKDAKLIKMNGEEVSAADGLKDNIIGLYFSASWCPPCRQFTPLLANNYKELRKRGSKFQIVFVSSDKSEDEMMQYFNECHGNWLAVAFGQPITQQLQEEFSVTAIPKLIILSENGEVITTRGRKEVTDRGVGAFRTWCSGSKLHTRTVSSSSLNDEATTAKETKITETKSSAGDNEKT